MDLYLEKIKKLLEEALRDEITHVYLVDECESILFLESSMKINDNLKEREIDLLQEISLEWMMYIQNTVNPSILKPGVDLIWLKIPEEWLLNWLNQIQRFQLND
ncbi:hypothetical protein [Shouchella miscanthi]|uniref:hypothetical protein n=1 Tax=Shouchella miscanthi TaxID=2598861 RepID=UPI0011AA93CA|nr:hypothetical protein [Shouchella miscanthi]